MLRAPMQKRLALQHGEQLRLPPSKAVVQDLQQQSLPTAWLPFWACGQGKLLCAL